MSRAALDQACCNSLRQPQLPRGNGSYSTKLSMNEPDESSRTCRSQAASLGRCDVSLVTSRGGVRGRTLPPPACWLHGSPGVSWCRWGIDARLSRWSAPRTNDLDSLLGTRVAYSTDLRHSWSSTGRETGLRRSRGCVMVRC